MAARQRGGIGVHRRCQGAQPGGVPVRLHDVDGLAIAHPVLAADSRAGGQTAWSGECGQFGAASGCVR